MGTLVAATPAQRPSAAWQPPLVAVFVKLANVGPNPIRVDVGGVRSCRELFVAIEREFGLPKGTAARLDCRIATSETWPRTEAAADEFFRGPKPTIQSTVEFPDVALGLVPGCWIVGRILWPGMESPSAGLGKQMEQFGKAVVGYLTPLLSIFTTESSGGHSDGHLHDGHWDDGLSKMD